MSDMIRANEWSAKGKSPAADELQTLTWTDPESGQRLTLRLRGSARFLQALEPLGFELIESIAGEPFEDHDTRGGTTRAWVSVKAHLRPEDAAR